MHCPNGIDVYFDNVSGEILEAALSLLNLRARIPVCGMISQYNTSKPAPGPRNLANLIMKRAHIEGFLVSDYYNRANEAVPKLIEYNRQGKLQYKLDIMDWRTRHALCGGCSMDRTQVSWWSRLRLIHGKLNA